MLNKIMMRKKYNSNASVSLFFVTLTLNTKRLQSPNGITSPNPYRQFFRQVS